MRIRWYGPQNTRYIYIEVLPLHLIILQAHKLQYKVEPSRRVPYDDMFSAGVLGMLEAARKFHIQPAESMQGSTVVENSVRFSTFAHSYITKQMRQAMMNYDANDIYIPRYAKNFHV